MTKINPALIDVFPNSHDGYPMELAREDTRDNLMAAAGDTVRVFPASMWIEPKDWPAVAAENDRNRTWPIDWLDRTTNQNPTHECTCHSLRALFESARNRQRGISLGPPKPGELLYVSSQSASVWVSVLSIYAIANPNIRGGANVRQVLEIAVENGFIPDKTQPREYGFKHTLTGTQGKGNVTQSSGDWVAERNFPDGWKETAKWFRPLEVVFPESWEEAVCLVLNGHGVGVGRSGHAVPWMLWNAEGGEMQYVDSYDRFLYDSVRTQKAAWRGSFSIISTVAPDSWDHPAGE